ncbi:Ig-like domain-containing protein [Pontibacter chitinilyticus]|uniref:Ig-like domain-containing protein n=1 Tax=Pontibacter chitinilyticus TaxID=2674989 RepID=UPI00321A3784
MKRKLTQTLISLLTAGKWTTLCLATGILASAQSAFYLPEVTAAATNHPQPPIPFSTFVMQGQASAAIPDSLRPYVSAVRPANDASEVALDKSVSVDLEFPSGKSIDGSTVNSTNVRLYEVIGVFKKPVSGTAVNTTAAGDAITLSASLALNTTYQFEITDQVKDLNGYAMKPFTSRFTTTNTTPTEMAGLDGVAFTPKTLITTSPGDDGFTTLVIGPDHRLYATTSGGKIERWDIDANGSLNNQVTIAPFGDTRQLLIGFHFDPFATADNLVAWMSHSSASFNGAPDWSSKITRIDLNNPDKPESKTYVTNLPRSTKDHAINSIDFGPDGALYVLMGSNTAMGAANKLWGNRPERLLSAAVLRLDISKAEKQTLPIDAKTPDGEGTYNPYAKNAPLTIFATGIRNAYDMVWHSNGQLYVPTNGSAAGGSTPALTTSTIWSNGKPYTGVDVPAMNNVRATQSDYLYRVEKGGYYGHPNALRHEYILNGGNPTGGEDPAEIVWTNKGKTYGYAVGTPKEPNFRGWVYNFGPNISPNGAIEYRSNAFDGKLQGRLLICRFSGGDDLIVLEPSPTTKEIVSAVEGIQVPGLRRPYANPLDVVEDEFTGNLYISEYFDVNGKGKPQITLLKANDPAKIIMPPADEPVSMLVYPNPVKDRKMILMLHQLGQQEDVLITMIDVEGRIVDVRKLTSKADGTLKTELIVAPALHGGLYFVKAQTASGKVEYRKVIVQ